MRQSGKDKTEGSGGADPWDDQQPPDPLHTVLTIIDQDGLVRQDAPCWLVLEAARLALIEPVGITGRWQLSNMGAEISSRKIHEI